MERRLRAPEREQPPVQGEHRARILALGLDALKAPASSTIGSQGLDVEIPACGPPRAQGIGERSGSRPATSTIRPGGTRTSGSPSSSP